MNLETHTVSGLVDWGDVQLLPPYFDLASICSRLYPMPGKLFEHVVRGYEAGIATARAMMGTTTTTDARTGGDGGSTGESGAGARAGAGGADAGAGAGAGAGSNAGAGACTGATTPKNDGTTSALASADGSDTAATPAGGTDSRVHHGGVNLCVLLDLAPRALRRAARGSDPAEAMAIVKAIIHQAPGIPQRIVTAAE